MRDKKSLTVYLAGPVSNCNEKQKTAWREEIKKELKKYNHRWKDPVDHLKGWKFFDEMVEIDHSDVVIANLWRESVGTVVGVVQALSKGKPVILIDPNHIAWDSKVLNVLIGQDFIVRGIREAVNKLENQIAPELREEVLVRKQDGRVEPFKVAKLLRSLNTLCADAGIGDALLPDLIARQVYAAARKSATESSERKKAISSDDITRLVFGNLSQLALQSNQLYEYEFKARASRMKDEWERQNRLKDDQRVLEEFGYEIESVKKENAAVKAENESLNSVLRDCERQLGAIMCADGDDAPKTVREALQLASVRFSKRLVIHAKAQQSALDSPYKHPQKVYYVLSLLSQYASSRAESERLGLTEWLKERNCPFEYAPHESESTRNNREARIERMVQFDGSSFILRKHIKIGKAGDANHCCRLYFELLDPDKILIGYLGRHPSVV
jgi:ATP cone domain-containing protein